MHEILLTDNCSNEKISQTEGSSLNTGNLGIDDESKLNLQSICNNAKNNCFSSSLIPDKIDEDECKHLNYNRPKLIRHNLLSNEVSSMKYDTLSTLPCRYSPNKKAFKSSNNVSHENKVRQGKEESLISQNTPSKLSSSVEKLSSTHEKSDLLASSFKFHCPQNAIDNKNISILDNELSHGVQSSSYVEVKDFSKSEEIKDYQSVGLIQISINEKIATDFQKNKIVSKEPLLVSQEVGLSYTKEAVSYSTQSSDKSLENSAIYINKNKMEGDSDGKIPRSETLTKSICSPSVEELVVDKEHLVQDVPVLTKLILGSSLNIKVENFIRPEEINKEPPVKMTQVSNGLYENEELATDCQKSINMGEDHLQLPNKSELQEVVSSASQFHRHCKYSLNENSFNLYLSANNSQKPTECEIEEIVVSHGTVSPSEELLDDREHMLQDKPILNTLDFSSSLKVDNFLRSEKINEGLPIKIAQVSFGLNDNEVLRIDCQKDKNMSEEHLQLTKEYELSAAKNAISSASQLGIRSKYSLNDQSLNTSVSVDNNQKAAECGIEEVAVSHGTVSKLEIPVKGTCSLSKELVEDKEHSVQDRPIVNTLDSSSILKVDDLLRSETINEEQPTQVSSGLNDNEVLATDCQKRLFMSEEHLQLTKESKLSDSGEAISCSSQLNMYSKYSLNDTSFSASVSADNNQKETECVIVETSISHGTVSKLQTPIKVICSPSEELVDDKEQLIQDRPLLITFDSSSSLKVDDFLRSKKIIKELPAQVSSGLNDNEVLATDCQKRHLQLTKESELSDSEEANSSASQIGLCMHSKYSLDNLSFNASGSADNNQKETECEIVETLVSHGTGSKLETLIKGICSPSEELVDDKRHLLQDRPMLNTLDSSSSLKVDCFLRPEKINEEKPAQVSSSLNDNEVLSTDCQKRLIMIEEHLQLTKEFELSDSEEPIFSASQLCMHSKYSLNDTSFNASVGADSNQKIVETSVSHSNNRETECLIEVTGASIVSKLETKISADLIDSEKRLLQVGLVDSALASLDSALDLRSKKFIETEATNEEQKHVNVGQIDENENKKLMSDCQSSISISKQPLLGLDQSDANEVISYSSRAYLPSKEFLNKKSLDSLVCGCNKQVVELDVDTRDIVIAQDSSPKLVTSVEQLSHRSEIKHSKSHFEKNLKDYSPDKEYMEIFSREVCQSFEAYASPCESMHGLSYAINSEVGKSKIEISKNIKNVSNFVINSNVNDQISENISNVDGKAGLLASNFNDTACIHSLSSEISSNLVTDSEKFKQLNILLPESLKFPKKSSCETATKLEKLYVSSPMVLEDRLINSSNRASMDSYTDDNVVNCSGVTKSRDISNITDYIPIINSEESVSGNVSLELPPCKIISDIIENVDNEESSCLGNIKIVSITSGESCSINVGQDSFQEYQENSDNENISSPVSNIVENLYKNNDSNLVLNEKDYTVKDSECKVNVTNSDFSLVINATNDLCDKIINLDDISLSIDETDLSKCSSNNKRKLSEDEIENIIKRFRTSQDPITIKEEKFEGFPNQTSVHSQEMDITAVKQEIVEELSYNELDLSLEARYKLLTSSFIAKNQKQQITKFSPRNGSKFECSKKKKGLLRGKNYKNCSNSKVNFLDIPDCLKKIADGSKPSLLVERERINADAENEDDRKVLVMCLVLDSTVLDWAFIDTFLSHKESNAINIVQKNGGKNAFIFPPADSPRGRYFCVDLGLQFPFAMPSQTIVDCSDEVVPLSYPLEQFAMLCPSSTSVRAVSFKDKIIPIKTIEFAKETLEFAFNNTLLSSMKDSPILSCTLELPVDHKVWPDVPETLLLPNFNVDFSFPFTCSDKQRHYENILLFPFETQIPLKLMESQLTQDIPDELQRELDAERSSLSRLLGLASYYKYLSHKNFVQTNPQLSVTLSAIVSSFKPMIISQANNYGMKIEEARLITLDGIYSKNESILPSLIRGPVNSNKCNLFPQSGINKLERSVCKNSCNVLKRKRQS